MREYLFELRKKANKTQAEVEKTLRKYGVRIRYTAIERGLMWKDMSGNRANILAEALETTPEYIRKCEAEFGGYVGEHYNIPTDKPNRLKSKQICEYDESLTAEEKIFAQEYVPYAEKIISICRNRKYRSVLGSLIYYEDFYDLGMLAFLRSVKIISVKMKNDPSLIKAYEDPDTFFKHHFSYAIKAAYYNYIKQELTLKRKEYYHARDLDSTIDDKEKHELYEVTPSYDIPVSKQAESSCFLDTLYQYLSDKQRYACELLISGWDAKEIIKNGYASKADVGTIKFYLIQNQKFGKILWRAEDYKSGTLNVNYKFEINRWQVKLKHGPRFYSLGEYLDLNVALDLKTLAYFHISAGDFTEWYAEHIRANEYNIQAFTYPLPCDNGIDYSLLPVPSEKPRNNSYQSATKDNPVGIKFNSSANTYQAKIQRYNLGTYNSLEKALEIRKTAEKHYTAGDFTEWYEDLKSVLAKSKITYAALEKQPNNKYAVTRYYLRKRTNLGVYYEKEALEVKALADSHIDKGDFDEWAKTFYAEYREKLQPCAYARISSRTLKNGSLSYCVERTYKQVTIGLGYYATKEEAQKIKASADSHIDSGDFDEWAEKFRSERKANKKKKSSSCVSKLAFTATYVICKYLIGMYRLLCYDTCGSEHLVCETADVEEAYKTMDLANEHIEAGDFNAWFADYKNI